MSAYLNAGQNRWNFSVLLVQGVAREVGYELSSEKLVLPFLYASLGGPLFFAGLLISTVEFCKFVAQISGSPLVAFARRTKWHVGLTTAVSAATLAVLSFLSEDLSPHFLVVAFVLTAAIIGLCKGVNNLAFQDLLGRSLFEGSRARLLFVSGSVTGLFVILSVIGSIAIGESESAHAAHIELILIGFGMLMAASLIILFLNEPAKAPEAFAEVADRRSTLQGYFAELRVGTRTVADLEWFHKYLKVRILLVPIEIAMPFFAIHASALHPDTTPSLSLFVIAGSAGMILGGIVWPRLSRNSNRLNMSMATLIGCLCAIGALMLQFIPDLRMPMTHAGVFLLLAFATQGVVVSRTVYLVNAASDAQRPYCVSLSNLAGGVVGLGLAFVLGGITQIQGAIAALLVMIPLNVVAAIYAIRLPAIGEARN